MTGSVRVAARHAARAGLPTGLALAAGIVASNVLLPQRIDLEGPGVVLGYLTVFAVFSATGARAARSGGWRSAALAGALTGALVAVLAVLAFLLIDNAFTGAVGARMRLAGATPDVRADLNQRLLRTAPGLFLLLTLVGCALGAFGAAFARPRDPVPPR
jgi:ascorbate-specific PTS system EIIC-type component UlaA